MEKINKFRKYDVLCAYVLWLKINEISLVAKEMGEWTKTHFMIIIMTDEAFIYLPVSIPPS